MARNLFEYRKVRADLGDPALPCQIGVVTRVTIPKPAAESHDGCSDYLPLAAEARTVTADLKSPDVARNVKIRAGAANTKNVTIHGMRGSKKIKETIQLGGTTSKPGSLAFDLITAIDLPVETVTSTKQKGTVAVTAVTAEGEPTLTFTSAATGAAFTIDVLLEAADIVSTTTAAAKIVEALNDDAKFAAKWIATSEAAVISIEALAPAAQDATLDLVVTDADDTGLTMAAVTVDAVSGVAPDKVQVGFGKKFGIPVALAGAHHVLLKYFDGSADTGAVTADSADIEKNVIALNGTPDGAKDIEIVCLKF